MRNINSKHTEAVIRLINDSPYFSLLSIKVLSLGQGYCRLEIDLEEKHLNPFGGIHGGVYASAVDTAAYWAVYYSVDEDVGLVSLDLQVDNLSPARSGKIIVEGEQVKAGRTVCVADCTVKDENGKLLAHGKSKQMVTAGLQTVNQALAVMGQPSLPPKFL